MSYYPILPHPTFDEVDYATWENGFTDDECNEIIRLGEQQDAKSSTVGGKIEYTNQVNEKTKQNRLEKLITIQIVLSTELN